MIDMMQIQRDVEGHYVAIGKIRLQNISELIRKETYLFGNKHGTDENGRDWGYTAPHTSDDKREHETYTTTDTNGDRYVEHRYEDGSYNIWKNHMPL